MGTIRTQREPTSSVGRSDRLFGQAAQIRPRRATDGTRSYAASILLYTFFLFLIITPLLSLFLLESFLDPIVKDQEKQHLNSLTGETNTN